ncbi:MAG: hypothetical protein OWU84_14435 [Firmicutes bacterium]|nr:hypothetical protein [Bacillota bacterium]
MSHGYDSLIRDFVMPDPRYGPVPLWWWDAEEVTPERIRWQMEKFRQGGLTNLCVINLAPAGPNFGSAGSLPAFYSERWWECWEATVLAAERLGMFLWYYDQIGFSGANFPAQLAMAHPEFRGHQLIRWHASEANPCPVWFRMGEWVYGVQRVGFDWLNPAATALLMDRIHGEMERRMGPWLGRVIVGSFQDELPPLPTWSDRLLERYAARYGEDLQARIPELFDRTDGAAPRSELRRRVYSLLAEMAEEAFFRPLGEWHAAHRMMIGCDQAGPGREVDPYGAQRLYLDYPRTHRWFQAPGNDPDGEIKMHASIAHQWRQPRVWLEAFHSSGWGGTLEETLHWLLPWYQAGATLYNPHAVYFSTAGGWWEWAAPDTGWRQPYFEHYPIFAQGIARLSKLLSQGRHVADIAVYYPGHAIWESMDWPSGAHLAHPMDLARTAPNRRIERIQEQFWSVVGRQNRHRPELGALRAARWDFDTLDDETLRAAVLTEEGIKVSDEAYRVLIFPGTERVDPESRERLQAWIDAGGIAIGVGVPPEERVFQGVRQIASAAELNETLETLLPRRVKGPGQSLIRHWDDGTLAFLLMPPEGTLVPMHEAVEASELPPQAVDYWLSVQGIPELWDPWSGEQEALAYSDDGGGIKVQVPLVRWPAALVVVRPKNASTAFKGAQDRAQQRPYPAQVGAPGPSKVRLDEDGWLIRVEPTLDNRYQDFDRHWNEAAAGVEIRRVEVAEDPEDQGVAEGWWQTDTPGPGRWQNMLWSEATSWWMRDPGNPEQKIPLIYSTIFGDLSFRTWAGRMARVPRTFLNLGSVSVGERRVAYSFVNVPKDGAYWLRVEGSGIKTVSVDQTVVVHRGRSYASTVSVFLSAGWHKVEVEIEAVTPGVLRMGASLSTEPPSDYPEWIKGDPDHRVFFVQFTLPDTFREAALHFVVMDGSAELVVNGRQVLRLGDFMPYRKWGQQEIDVTSWLKTGCNEMTLRFLDMDENARAFIDMVWTDASGERHVWDVDAWRDESQNFSPPVLEPTEDHWLAPRPHLLPHVGWLEPDAKTDDRLPWVADPERLGNPLWIRARLPVGAAKVRLAIEGQVTAWVDGQAVEVHHGSLLVKPAPAGRMLVLRVVPQGFFSQAGVLRAPILVETAAASGQLGDWRDALGLTTFSGVVEYERWVEGTSQRAVLDLGEVRGTAEVWVDSWNAGVRLWHPYQFDLAPAWGPGPHRLRVRVTNTLGAYYGDGKPTALCPVSQQRSGLFGPVFLFEG